MGSDYGKRRALCPYYIRDRDARIVCEGWCAGVNNQVNLRDDAQKKRYMDAYCDTYAWEDCRVAQMLEDKYSEKKEAP